jgi:hypothetical protein
VSEPDQIDLLVAEVEQWLEVNPARAQQAITHLRTAQMCIEHLRTETPYRIT